MIFCLDNAPSFCSIDEELPQFGRDSLLSDAFDVIALSVSLYSPVVLPNGIYSPDDNLQAFQWLLIPPELVASRRVKARLLSSSVPC